MEIEPVTQSRNRYFTGGIYRTGGLSCTVIDLAKLAKNKQPTLIAMDKLVHNLYNKCWTSDHKEISPITVISYIKLRAGKSILELRQGEFGEHVTRVLRADLSYPLIIDPDYDILDGCHRLCKYYINSNNYDTGNTFNNVRCIMLSFDEIYSICAINSHL